MRTITYEAGGLYFTTYTKSAKVRHLRTDPEAACVVCSEDGVSWVSVRGRAIIYQPAPEEVRAMLGRSSPEARVSEAVVANVHDRLLSGKRSFIRLDVDEVVARG
jgi:nitroimidazol reductase NimA-like FMN-containing flavoprotein (pyridoxamine 5'-phosphate oxidase superfamily)